MAHHQFIPGLHFQCLSELIAIVRQGRLREEYLDAIQHGAWFAGCAAAQFDTTPDVIGSSDGEPIPESLEDKVAALEAMVPEGDSYTISPTQIVLIIRLVLAILKQI